MKLVVRDFPWSGFVFQLRGQVNVGIKISILRRSFFCHVDKVEEAGLDKGNKKIKKKKKGLPWWRSG